MGRDGQQKKSRHASALSLPKVNGLVCVPIELVSLWLWFLLYLSPSPSGLGGSLGKIEGRGRRGSRGWDGWMASLTQWASLSPSKLWEIVAAKEPGVMQSRGSQRVGHDLATEQQQRQSREGGICKPWVSRTPSARMGPSASTGDLGGLPVKNTRLWRSDTWAPGRVNLGRVLIWGNPWKCTIMCNQNVIRKVVFTEWIQESKRGIMKDKMWRYC